MIVEGLIFYRCPLYHPTSNLPDCGADPVKRICIGCVLGLARRIHSDISPISLLNFTGVKGAKFGLDFRLQSPIFEMRPTF